jgi:hypothetical protein
VTHLVTPNPIAPVKRPKTGQGSPRLSLDVAEARSFLQAGAAAVAGRLVGLGAHHRAAVGARSASFHVRWTKS